MTEARKPGQPRLDLIIDPLDYQILDQLPIEGTLHFGAYPVGKTVVEIMKVIGEGHVSGGTIGARLRIMAEEGWTVRVRSIGGGGRNAWQRTKAGEQLLHKWKGDHGSDT